MSRKLGFGKGPIHLTNDRQLGEAEGGEGRWWMCPMIIIIEASTETGLCRKPAGRMKQR